MVAQVLAILGMFGGGVKNFGALAVSSRERFVDGTLHDVAVLLDHVHFRLGICRRLGDVDVLVSFG